MVTKIRPYTYVSLSTPKASPNFGEMVNSTQINFREMANSTQINFGEMEKYPIFARETSY